MNTPAPLESAEADKHKQSTWPSSVSGAKAARWTAFFGIAMVALVVACWLTYCLRRRSSAKRECATRKPKSANQDSEDSHLSELDQKAPEEEDTSVKQASSRQVRINSVPVSFESAESTLSNVHVHSISCSTFHVEECGRLDQSNRRSDLEFSPEEVMEVLQAAKNVCGSQDLKVRLEQWSDLMKDRKTQLTELNAYSSLDSSVDCGASANRVEGILAASTGRSEADYS